jgi:hypothetical protein
MNAIIQQIQAATAELKEANDLADYKAEQRRKLDIALRVVAHQAASIQRSNQNMIRLGLGGEHVHYINK